MLKYSWCLKNIFFRNCSHSFPISIDFEDNYDKDHALCYILNSNQQLWSLFDFYLRAIKNVGQHSAVRYKRRSMLSLANFIPITFYRLNMISSFRQYFNENKKIELQSCPKRQLYLPYLYKITAIVNALCIIVKINIPIN